MSVGLPSRSVAPISCISCETDDERAPVRVSRFSRYSRSVSVSRSLAFAPGTGSVSKSAVGRPAARVRISSPDNGRFSSRRRTSTRPSLRLWSSRLRGTWMPMKRPVGSSTA